MGADRATTGTDAGLDGSSATAGAANPSNAASSAAGQQLCKQLVAPACMCLARQMRTASTAASLLELCPDTVLGRCAALQQNGAATAISRQQPCMHDWCSTAARGLKQHHGVPHWIELQHYHQCPGSQCMLWLSSDSACKMCCAAVTKGSANGSAAAMGHLPSVAAAATSKGAATATSSTQDVSSAVGANKLAGERSYACACS